MQHWYSKPLGDGMWAHVSSDEIAQLFQPLFEAADKPAEMAIFTRSEEGRLHCEWTAYFSPAAADVAKAVEANPCARPARAGLSLLAGSNECWAILFGCA